MSLDCLNPPNMGNFMTLLYRPCGPTQQKSPPGLHAISETPQRLAERSGRFLHVHILLLDGGEIKYCYISTSLGWDIGKPHWKKTMDKLPTSTGQMSSISLVGSLVGICEHLVSWIIRN